MEMSAKRMNQELVGSPSIAEATKSKPKRKTHHRKFKKAIGAPKRCRSAFIFFSTNKYKEIRAKLEAEDPEGTAGRKSTDITKQVAEAWNLLKPEEKEEWNEMARKDKERYEADKKSYQGPWRVEVRGRKKNLSHPDAPKRPMSAFLAYANANRALVKQEHPECTNGEISRILSQRWKEAPADEKQKFIEEEQALRQKYKIAIEEWEFGLKDEIDPNEPVKPKRPMSAFFAFANSRRAAVKAENPSFNNAETSRHLAQQWRDAPEEEKQKYLEEEFELRQKYKEEKTQWKKARVAAEKMARKNEQKMARAKTTKKRKAVAGPQGMGDQYGAFQQPNVPMPGASLPPTDGTAAILSAARRAGLASFDGLQGAGRPPMGGDLYPPMDRMPPQAMDQLGLSMPSQRFSEPAPLPAFAQQHQPFSAGLPSQMDDNALLIAQLQQQLQAQQRHDPMSAYLPSGSAADELLARQQALALQREECMRELEALNRYYEDNQQAYQLARMLGPRGL